MWPLDIIIKRNQQAAENIAAGRPERVESELLTDKFKTCSECPAPELCKQNALCEDQASQISPEEYHASRNVDHAEWDGPQEGEHTALHRRATTRPVQNVEIGFSVEYHLQDAEILESAIKAIDTHYRVKGVSRVSITRGGVSRNAFSLKASVPVNEIQAFIGFTSIVAKFLGRREFFVRLPDGSITQYGC